MHLNTLRPMGIALAVCTLALGGSSNDSGGSGGQSVPKMTPAASVGAGEGQLNLIAWAGYAENGSNDPKVDWVTPFEKNTGCKVNVKTANTSDEMVALNALVGQVSALGRLDVVIDPTVSSMGVSLHERRFYLHVNPDYFTASPKYLLGESYTRDSQPNVVKALIARELMARGALVRTWP